MKIVENRTKIAKGELAAKLVVEKTYEKILKSKSPKEKIKLADGLFEYAKKVNPKAFQCPKRLKHQESY